jgi:magnesium transporter
MKNPLLVPEIRDMLSSNQIDQIEDFCTSTVPSVVADFLGALASEEIWIILANLPVETRAAIFISFDEDVKVALIDLLTDHDLIDLAAELSPEEIRALFAQLPLEEQDRLVVLFKDTQREDLLRLLSHVEPVFEPIPSISPIRSPGEGAAFPSSPQVTIYKTSQNKVHSVPQIEEGCWVNIVKPDKEEVEALSQYFNVPPDFLTASLDIDEIARIETEDGATLIILKTPFFDETNLDVLYFTLPIGIILTGDLIITVCAKESNIIQDFLLNKVRNFSSANRQKFILQLFLRATLLYLQYLKQINNATNVIQKKLEQSSQNKQLIKLLNIEKSLVYFTTSLKSNALMLERMQKLSLLGADPENEDLYDDIVIESKQAIEMADIYSDILSGMMDAFASIISNNLNIVMRALTSIAIIITLPIILASLYGMNVRLPLQDSPYAFLVIILLSLLLILLGLAFFVKNKWLDM